MPDISMCSSTTCPSRKKCYRHKADPNPLCQSYADFDNTRGDKKKCEYFALYIKKKPSKKGKRK
jgi:hypothetical protein